MSKWILEPGHTGAEFTIRHMMVTWVRGHFKDIHGSVEFDPENPKSFSVEAEVGVENIWTGESARDQHLKSGDFFEVETFSRITFQGNTIVALGENDFRLTGDLTIRDVTREVSLDLHYLGHWKTPYWLEDGDHGPVNRIGFTAETVINRYDFGVNWNDTMENEGFILGQDVRIRIDAEAILESDITRIEEAA